MNVLTVKVDRQGQLKRIFLLSNLLYSLKRTFKLCSGLFSFIFYFTAILLQKIWGSTGSAASTSSTGSTDSRSADLQFSNIPCTWSADLQFGNIPRTWFHSSASVGSL